MTNATSIRHRKGSAPTMNLGDEVTVRLEISGRIVARTLDAQAYVDIVAPDGTVWRNIPAAWVEPAAKVVPLPLPLREVA